MKYLCVIFLILLSISIGSEYIKPIDGFNELTKHNVKIEIMKQGILHYNVVFNQCLLETGNLKFTHKNNLFGFNNGKHLRFNHWKDSVKKYKQWQVKYYRDTTENYYLFLERIKYSENKHYTKLLKLFKNEKKF